MAPVGFALAVILIAAIGGSAWWTHRTQSRMLAARRVAHVAQTGLLLRTSAEALLVDDDLSAVRRLIVQTAQQESLRDCRIVLLDGRVIAAADPARITEPRLDARWPQGTDATERQTVDDGLIRITHVVDVPGRGRARLEISAPAHLAASAWALHAGAAVVAAGSLVALLLVYRHTRSRLRVLGEIREALLAMHAGEKSLDAVRLSDRFGREADAWNQLLTESQKVRREQVAARAHRSLGTDRRSSGGLAAACDAMSQGIILLDDQTNVCYANGAAAIFLEALRDDIVTTPFDQQVEDPKLLDVVRAVCSGSSKRRVAVEIDRAQKGEGDNHGILRFSVRPVKAGQGAAAMIQIDDVTQQRVAEDARHSFVAQATHELRTPLTNIRLSAETAIDADADNKVIRAHCLNVINQEARRLEHIVAEMLSVAEIEAGAISLQKDDVPLKIMLGELMADYRAQSEEKSITFRFELPPKLPNLHGDRDKIMLALHNLIGNALKYTPSGRQVTVTVEHEANDLVIQVADTGIGIGPEDSARIFEKFYRAHDQRVGKITGSGLGLALAREVIRLHDGDITVESELDRGSTFTMTLPVEAVAA